MNRLLQGVVREGTATRAAIPGWSVAGKTGTTENYGDAWFVGYTPELVVAVWVGYPKGLRPMLTEFDGESVTGGSFPAEIFKTFAEQALPYLGKQPVGFDQPPSDWVAPLAVVQRDGLLQRDNGNCRNAYTVLYFGGAGPKRTANCKPNEVEVPNLVGRKLAAAEQRLAEQPLGSVVLYRPAEPGEPLGVVVEQIPRKGRALGVRRDPAVAREADARRHPARAGAHARHGSPEARAAEARRPRRLVDRRAAVPGRLPGAQGRRRRGARDARSSSSSRGGRRRS